MPTTRRRISRWLHRYDGELWCAVSTKWYWSSTEMSMEIDGPHPDLRAHHHATEFRIFLKYGCWACCSMVGCVLVHDFRTRHRCGILLLEPQQMCSSQASSLFALPCSPTLSTFPAHTKIKRCTSRPLVSVEVVQSGELWGCGSGVVTTKSHSRRC